MPVRYQTPKMLMWYDVKGNSNSLSTVDIAAGYVGLQSYSAPLIALLMCLNTYAGPIYWLLALQCLLAELCGQDVKRWDRFFAVKSSVLFLRGSRSLSTDTQTCVDLMCNWPCHCPPSPPNPLLYFCNKSPHLWAILKKLFISLAFIAVTGIPTGMTPVHRGSCSVRSSSIWRGLDQVHFKSRLLRQKQKYYCT